MFLLQRRLFETWRGEKTMLQRPEALSITMESLFPALFPALSYRLPTSLFSFSLFLRLPHLLIPYSRHPLVKFFCMPVRRLVSRNTAQYNPGMHCGSVSLDIPVMSTTRRRLCTMISELADLENVFCVTYRELM